MKKINKSITEIKNEIDYLKDSIKLRLNSVFLLG